MKKKKLGLGHPQSFSDNAFNTLISQMDIFCPNQMFGKVDEDVIVFLFELCLLPM